MVALWFVSVGHGETMCSLTWDKPPRSLLSRDSSISCRVAWARTGFKVITDLAGGLGLDSSGS